VGRWPMIWCCTALLGVFYWPPVGWRARVSPENAREYTIFEKTRTISSFSFKFLRKSANSVAETVQIFGHLLAGKIEWREITVDQDVIELAGAEPGQNRGDDPPACSRYSPRGAKYLVSMGSSTTLHLRCASGP
jgi:hypothetical protein